MLSKYDRLTVDFEMKSFTLNPIDAFDLNP